LLIPLLKLLSRVIMLKNCKGNRVIKLTGALVEQAYKNGFWVLTYILKI
jgi:hypothetical protein